MASFGCTRVDTRRRGLWAVALEITGKEATGTREYYELQNYELQNYEPRKLLTPPLSFGGQWQSSNRANQDALSSSSQHAHSPAITRNFGLHGGRPVISFFLQSDSLS